MDWIDITVAALRASVGPVAVAYALAGLGLNLQFGYAGLWNYGHVVAVAAGAYGAAIPMEAGATFVGGVTADGEMFLISVRFPTLVVGVLCGVAAALVVSLFLGVAALRLRLDYLAIATIAFGEIFRQVVRSNWAEPITGGVFGIQQFANDFFDLNPIPINEDRYGWGDFSYDYRSLWLMIVGWTLIAIGVLLMYLLVHSPWGRAVRATREDEQVARSLGKNVFFIRLQSFMIGSVFGAFAGVLLAFANNVNPDFYNLILTFWVYTALLIGGLGRVLGPVAGAVVFWFLFQWFEGFMRSSIQEGWYGNFLQDTDTGPFRFMLLGLILMLLVVFRPQGFFGDKEEALLDGS